MKRNRKSRALSTADTQRLLGSETPISVGKLPIDPVGMKAIASIVRERLISRGGRPSDPAWTISRKVPMRSETWEELDRIAQKLQKQNIRVSAGQVAAIALERGLPKGVDSGESIQLFVSSTHEEATTTIEYNFSPEVSLRARQTSHAMAKFALFS